MLKKSASSVLARHCRLTISAAFTNVPRLIRRDVNLRGSTYRVKYASPLGHGRLTVSPASTNVALIMLRAVDLAAALLDGLFEHPRSQLRISLELSRSFATACYREIRTGMDTRQLMDGAHLEVGMS